MGKPRTGGTIRGPVSQELDALWPLDAGDGSGSLRDKLKYRATRKARRVGERAKNLRPVFVVDGWRHQVDDCTWDEQTGKLSVDVRVTKGKRVLENAPLEFVNPPILVPDGSEVPNFTEDIDQAFQKMVAEAAQTSAVHVRKAMREKGVTLEEALNGDPTLTVYSDAADGIVYSHNATYSTSRGGTGATARTNLTNEGAGQEYNGGEYYCYEVFLGWDTSSLTAGATISAATASLHATATDNSAQDFTLQMRPSDWGATLTAADFVPGATFNGLTISATKASSGWTTSAYNDLTETSTNLQTNINKTGFSRFVLCSDRFASGAIAPNVDGTDEYLLFYLGDQAGTTNDPKLVVTYTGGVEKTGTDDGTGTDAGTIAVTRTKTGTDDGTGTESTSLDVAQNVIDSDSGTGSDDATVEKSVYKTGTDSGAATESTSLDILEGIADTDGGVATDVGSVVSTWNFLNQKEVRSHMSATIREAFPDQPDSTDGQASIYERLSGTTGARQRVLLDVSRVVDLLRGGEVARAELNLPRPETFEGTITVWPIAAAWDPGTVTWNNQPAVRAAEAVTYVVPAGTDPLNIVVTAMVENSVAAQDSASLPWHGVMLGWSENAEAKLYSSYADRDLQPFLDIDPSYIPDAPTHLRPSGGKAVSEVRPELAAEWRDPSGEQSMAGIHVIVATDEALESPVFDSGEVDHDVPRYDLNDPPSAGITLATSAAADDIIDTTAAHGLAEGDHVVFTSLTGGAGLSTGTIYYVIAANLGSTTFQVSATEGGAAVDFTTDITAGSTGPADLVTATPLYWAERVRNAHGNWSDWSEVAEFQVVAKNALTITSPASSTVTSPVLQLTWTMTDQAAREIVVWKRQNASDPWIEHYREDRNPSTSLSLTGPVPDTLLEEGWTYKAVVDGWDDVERDSMAGDPSYSEDTVEFILDLP